jgi:HAMP domain-containing protein
MQKIYGVRLIRPVDASERDEIAAQVAARFGVEPEKLSRLLSKGSGLLTRPTDEAEARRVAEIFASAGADVEVVALDEPDEPPSPAQPRLEASTPSRAQPVGQARDTQERVAPPRSDTATKGKGEEAQGAARTEEKPSPPVRSSPLHPPSRTQAEPRPNRAATPPRSETPWESEPPLREHAGVSLRWATFFAIFLPSLLTLGVVLAFSYLALERSARHFAASLGDNVAVALASDLSFFITENALDMDDPQDLEAIRFYFTQRVTAFGPATHQALGIHLAGAGGAYLGGFWESQFQQGQTLTTLEARLLDAHEAALANADFGDPAAELAASLPLRTLALGGGWVVAAPLINDLGSVQVVVAETGLLQGVALEPLVLAALVALLVLLILAALLSLALTRPLKRVATAAERLSVGELTRPIRAQGTGEVRAIAQALERLRIAIMTLRRHTR